jgi:hypothetical protein
MQPPLHSMMQERLAKCLADRETRQKATENFIHTLTQIGLSKADAENAVQTMFAQWSDTSRPLKEVENDVFAMLMKRTIDGQEGKINVGQAVDRKMADRAKIVFGQIKPYLERTPGSIIDVGCGDAQVTELIHQELKPQGVTVEGVDVRAYRAPGVTVPTSMFDGKTVNVSAGAFKTGVLTNVLHHERDNDNILKELDRIVGKRLVIIETVPIGNNEAEMEKDKDRTFMNDYFYNRCLHDPKFDIPVPGTFESPQAWVKRLKTHGWKTVHEQDLGIDQPTIHDRHYLIVAEKETPAR